MPLPETVTAFLEASAPGAAALPDALRAWLATRLREPLPSDVWDGVDAAPAFDRATCVSSTPRARNWRAGAISRRCGRSWARRRSSRSRRPVPPSSDAGCKRWDFGDLPETLTRERGGQRITGYPALVDDDDSVSLALLDTRAAAEASTRAGVVRLIRFALQDALGRFEKGGPGVRAGRAPAAHDDSDRSRCWPTCSPRSPTVRSSATIRCRARSRRSPSR